MELVKTIFELKFKYLIDEEGRIYSEKYKRPLQQFTDKDGYLRVSMMTIDNKRKSIPVHRCVLMTFCPCENMSQLQVNHKDGNKTNNCLSNLEWVTNQENIAHAVINNLHAFGEKNYFASISEDMAQNIINDLLLNKYTMQEIADNNRVSITIVENIKYKKTWKHLTKNISFNKSNGKKLTENDVIEIKNLLASGMTNIKIARLFNISKSTVSSIKNNKTWKHI